MIALPAVRTSEQQQVLQLTAMFAYRLWQQFIYFFLFATFSLFFIIFPSILYNFFFLVFLIVFSLFTTPSVDVAVVFIAVAVAAAVGIVF